MYSGHGIQPLHDYFRSFFTNHAAYLAEHTNTDWNFPEELTNWISKIEAMDSSSTFFRYPVTRHKERDKDKSAIREDNYDNMRSNLATRQKPLKAFLMVDQDDEVVETFSYDNAVNQEVTGTLRNVAHLLYNCHAALIGELADGW